MTRNGMSAEMVHLSWPAAGDAQQYRVVVRDVAGGNFVLRLPCPTNACDLPLADLDLTRRYEWKVQVQRAGRWEDWRPYLALRPPPTAPDNVTRITWQPASAADALYRVVIHDGSAIVAKDVVDQTHYDVDWSRLGPGSLWRYRVQTRAADGTWVDLFPYRALQRPRRARPAAAPRTPDTPVATGSELLFLYTVDTEANIRYMRHPDYTRAADEHIFGRWGDREYGIGLMMDLLEEAGLKGTFFVDVLLHYEFGRAALERTVGTILDRGHDVQLHLHATPHLFYAPQSELRAAVDCMRDQGSEDFARVLELSVRCFEEVVGRPPIAYRAGSYLIQPPAFPLLQRHGIRIDSSVYPFKNCQVPSWMAGRTQPFWVDGVLEVPVSWFVERRPDGLRARQFNLNVGITPAILSAVQTPCPFVTGPRTLIFMAHSYTLLREVRTQDAETHRRWHEEFAAVTEKDVFARRTQDPNMAFFEGPDENRIAMLQTVLQQVAEQPHVRGVTMRDIHDHWLARFPEGRGPVEPVALWDVPTQRLRWIGLRRYNAAWLNELETSTAGAEPARQGACEI